jgi:hypothetical protein
MQIKKEHTGQKRVSTVNPVMKKIKIKRVATKKTTV